MKAITEPTDRSIPPEMITKVMPTATMPRKALSVRRLADHAGGSEVRKLREADRISDDEDHERDENRQEAPDHGWALPARRRHWRQTRRLRQQDGEHHDRLHDEVVFRRIAATAGCRCSWPG